MQNKLQNRLKNPFKSIVRPRFNGGLPTNIEISPETAVADEVETYGDGNTQTEPAESKEKSSFEKPDTDEDVVLFEDESMESFASEEIEESEEGNEESEEDYEEFEDEDNIFYDNENIEDSESIMEDEDGVPENESAENYARADIETFQEKYGLSKYKKLIQRRKFWKRR